MQTMKVKLTFLENLLGTASANPEIHQEYIASKAPDAASMEQEVAAVGAEEVFEKGVTVFPRNLAGKPILWNYQIEGFFKDACGMLKRVPDSESSKLKAYKKEIDGLIFVREREILIETNQPITLLQRPLRAQTAQGERVALASSECIAAGATITFTIDMLVDREKAVREWLDYGVRRGIGQWRNSGAGRFTWEEV